MATLIVRSLDDHLVAALKQSAAYHNRSAEEEHREILRAALLRPKRQTLAQALLYIPTPGRARDYR